MIKQLPTLENKLINNHPFIILTDLKNLEIKFLNPSIKTFLGLSSDITKEKFPEFKEDILHPEDYCDFIKNLSSLRDPSEDEIMESETRLKSRNNKWKKYKLISRRYNYNFEGDATVAITLGFPVAKKNKIPKAKHAEYESLKSELQHLLESLDDAFCIFEMIFDTHGHPVDYLFLETNPAFEKQINLKNVVGKTMRELIPDHENEWFEIYGKVAKTGEPKRFQFCAEKIENSWLDLYAFKVSDPKSNLVIVIFRDISERVQLEQELKQTKAELEKRATNREKDLKESSALLHTFFDTTNLGIAILKTKYSNDGEIIDFEYKRVNRVLQEMVGNRDILGQGFVETSNYGVKIGIFKALIKVAKSGKVLDKEFYFDEEGFHNWFRVTARKQNDLLAATIEDITERKAEAQQLKETIRFKRQLVRTSPETILIINLNSLAVRYINKSIFPEAGITREKIEGMPLTDIIPFVYPRDRELLMDLHKKLLKSTDDDIYDIELRLKLRGNTWEWFSVRGKIFHRQSAVWVDEYVLLVRNITQQKNTQKALLKAEKLSIQGEIARTLAHELRNPLASIGMTTEVLGKKLEGPARENVENYLEILSRSTKTLNSLISNLLNASNYSRTELKRMDLAKIVAKTILKASDRIYLSGIKVIKDFKGPYFVMGDEEKLEIAILNIIVNASEATKPEEGVITLKITKHKTDYLLSINDNGHGMDDKEIDRLFEAFYTSKSTGVGVGLNSVKTILEEHGAQIKVDSTPNLGTTFKLYFHNADIG